MCAPSANIQQPKLTTRPVDAPAPTLGEDPRGPAGAAGGPTTDVSVGQFTVGDIPRIGVGALKNLTAPVAGTASPMFSNMGSFGWAPGLPSIASSGPTPSAIPHTGGSVGAPGVTNNNGRYIDPASGNELPNQDVLTGVKYRDPWTGRLMDTPVPQDPWRRR